METIKKVKSAIEPIINEAGYILDDVQYEVGNLTVIIDKKGIVDIDDCVTVTKLINPVLDEKDFIEESYVLDVCSKEKGSE